MTRCWVRLNDGREFIVKISAEFVEEAAENEELIPALDGTLVPMVEVDRYAATTSSQVPGEQP